MKMLKLILYPFLISFLFSILDVNAQPHDYLNEWINYDIKTETVNHLFSTGVVDVSGNFKESPSVNKPGLKTINISKILKPGKVFLGFGSPNVFTGIVNDDGSVTQFDAKSLWREAAKITTNKHGNIQSGVILVPINLPEEALIRIQNSSQSIVGKKGVTCLKQNLEVLEGAGFHLEKGKLSSHIFPNNFLAKVMKREIMYTSLESNETIKVEFDVVRTTPQTLDSFYNSILWSQSNTILRHFERAIDSKESKEKRREQAKIIAQENNNRYEEMNALANMKNVVAGNNNAGELFSVSFAYPSYLGAFARYFWNDHILFKLDLTKYKELVDNELPDALKPFDQKKLSWFSWLKKNFLFNYPTIHFINDHMAHDFIDMPSVPGNYIIKALLEHPRLDGSNGKYNFVLQGDSLIITRINVYNKLADWVLSKHLVISNYSDDVRCSGEFWKDQQGVLHFNDDSGTYRPKTETMKGLKNILTSIFPDFEIVIHVSN